MKKILLAAVGALALTSFVASPVLAASKSYCKQEATQRANAQAAGKTLIGAGLGCALGALVAHRCGVGAALGGVGGFAIGSQQWWDVYHAKYDHCRKYE
jgi:hypothetical protein